MKGARGPCGHCPPCRVPGGQREAAPQLRSLLPEALARREGHRAAALVRVAAVHVPRVLY